MDDFGKDPGCSKCHSNNTLVYKGMIRLTKQKVVQKWNVLCGQEALKGKAVLEMHYDELMITLTPRSE